MICVSQVIILYTLNSYSTMCLYISIKLEEKKGTRMNHVLHSENNFKHQNFRAVSFLYLCFCCILITQYQSLQNVGSQSLFIFKDECDPRTNIHSTYGKYSILHSFPQTVAVAEQFNKAYSCLDYMTYLGKPMYLNADMSASSNASIYCKMSLSSKFILSLMLCSLS